MGFYIHNNPKMAYKMHFRPSELLCLYSGKWAPIEKVKDSGLLDCPTKTVFYDKDGNFTGTPNWIDAYEENENSKESKFLIYTWQTTGVVQQDVDNSSNARLKLCHGIQRRNCWN